MAVTTGTDTTHELRAEGLRLAYDAKVVVDGLSLAIPVGRITVIVGANACGKSTLLRALARLLRPQAGTVLLDGEEHPPAADQRGRHPARHPAPVAHRARGHHRGRPGGTGPLPAPALVPAVVAERRGGGDARRMEATGTTDLADRPSTSCPAGSASGCGSRWRWPRAPPLMLLDEPTTFLDMAHQVEVLDLLADLNATDGRTIVLVLHDLNQACRYGHHLIAMQAARSSPRARPADVVTESAGGRGLRPGAAGVVPDPVAGTPMIVPIGSRHRRPLVLAE